MERGDTKYFDADERPLDAEIRAFVTEHRDGKIMRPHPDAEPGRRGGTSKLHVPNKTHERPICPMGKRRACREKDANMFPSGFADWCEECMATVFPERAKMSAGGDLE